MGLTCDEIVAYWLKQWVGLCEEQRDKQERERRTAAEHRDDEKKEAAEIWAGRESHKKNGLVSPTPFPTLVYHRNELK